MTRNESRKAASWGAHMLRLKGWPWMNTTTGPSPASSWARSTAVTGPMLAADVSFEPGDRTPGPHRRGLLVNVGAGAGRHAGDIARHIAGYLRDANPGTRRVALLDANREALPVRRLEQHSQLPGLSGELGVV